MACLARALNTAMSSIAMSPSPESASVLCPRSARKRIVTTESSRSTSARSHRSNPATKTNFHRISYHSGYMRTQHGDIWGMHKAKNTSDLLERESFYFAVVGRCHDHRQFADFEAVQVVPEEQAVFSTVFVHTKL